MKLVNAIIQKDKLDEVREALIAANISRITVDRVTGHGRQKNIELYRGQRISPNLIAKVRLTIACNDEFVDLIAQTIIKSAKHEDGRTGDGKIFVTNLEQCYRISTGKTGVEAI